MTSSCVSPKNMDSHLAKSGKHNLARVDTPISTPPPTPTPAATTARDLHREIRNIHQQLVPLTSLAPSALVNTLLSRLVHLCIRPYSAEIVDHFSRIDGVDTLCHSLQGICAIAEGELERYWAQSILKDSAFHTEPTQTHTLLTSFPYHTNYLSLSAIEASLLTPFFPASPSNIAFIGSGPLPLTSLCLLTHFPSATIHNIDRDADALAVSSLLTEKLGRSDRMTFTCEDATDASSGRTKFESFDVVFLAALVGMQSGEKVAILRGLRERLRVGTVVVCRSARGMRVVLYPVLELSEELQSAGFEILAEMHPWSDVVNSVIVLRVRK